ncbi:MAG: response regulator transcription factor, partial [Anaerolineales bacterium]
AASLEALPAVRQTVDIFVLMTDPGDLSLLADLIPADEPAPAVLLLTDRPEDGETLLSLPLRAWGLLPTDCSEEALITSLYALDLGLIVGDATQLQPLLAAPSHRAENPDASNTALTERELEVLTLLADGLANKQISAALNISEHTVKFHVSSIYTKLDVSNRAEAVRQGIQLGWIMI